MGLACLFSVYGEKKLITVSFRTSVVLDVYRMADQAVLRFQFIAVTDKVSVLMFWGFEHHT